MIALSELHRQPPKDSLQATLEAYKTEPHTPELVTATWEAVWREWGYKLARNGDSLEVAVPDLAVSGWSQGEIEEPIRDVRGAEVPTGMMYFPPGFQGADGVRRLSTLFPQMRNWDLRTDLKLTNVQDETGWMNVETANHGVNVNTTEEDLRKHYQSQGRLGMNRNQYVVLAEFMRSLGRYIDYSAGSRLLGTRMGQEGGVIRAGVTANNGRSLSVSSADPYPHNGGRYSDGSLGGRSIKLKPTEAKSR